MAREKKRKKDDDTDEIEKTIDPYTGELKPVPEDADEFIEDKKASRTVRLKSEKAIKREALPST